MFSLISTAAKKTSAILLLGILSAGLASCQKEVIEPISSNENATANKNLVQYHVINKSTITSSRSTENYPVEPARPVVPSPEKKGWEAAAQ